METFSWEQSDANCVWGYVEVQARSKTFRKVWMEEFSTQWIASLDASSVAVRGTSCAGSANDPGEVDHVSEAMKRAEKAISASALRTAVWRNVARYATEEGSLIADEVEDKSTRRRQLSQLNRTAQG